MATSPHNLEAEQSVLGAVMLVSSVMPKVADILAPADFHHAAHVLIFASCMELHAAGAPVDLVTVADRLTKSGNLKAAGGAGYLAELAGAVTGGANAVYHAQLVRDVARRRRAIASADRLVDVFTAPGVTTAEMLEVVREVECDLSDGHDSMATMTAADVMGMEFSETPLIDGLLEECESLLICGPSGLGKSVLTLGMALSLAMPPAGGLWGQFRVPRPLRTVFVQSENTAKATQKRLAKMIHGHPAWSQALGSIFFPNVAGDLRMSGVLTDPAFCIGVEQAVKRVNADILILDPLISYHGEDENDNAAMRRSLDKLTAICTRLGVASIVVHHVGKSDANGNATFSGRGASAIGDWAASILSMAPVLDDKENRTNIIEMRHQKARNFEKRDPFFLERTEDLLLIPTDDPRDNGGRERVQAVVNALVAAGGSVASKRLLEIDLISKTGVSRATIQKWIGESIDRGAVKIVPGPGKRDGLSLVECGQSQRGQKNEWPRV